jgi:hypothetical protein
MYRFDKMARRSRRGRRARRRAGGTQFMPKTVHASHDMHKAKAVSMWGK